MQAYTVHSSPPKQSTSITLLSGSAILPLPSRLLALCSVQRTHMHGQGTHKSDIFITIGLYRMLQPAPWTIITHEQKTAPPAKRTSTRLCIMASECDRSAENRMLLPVKQPAQQFQQRPSNSKKSKCNEIKLSHQSVAEKCSAAELAFRLLCKC